MFFLKGLMSTLRISSELKLAINPVFINCDFIAANKAIEVEPLSLSKGTILP